MADQPSLPDDTVPEDVKVERFSPEEEASLLAESHEQKATANKLFTSSRYSEAIGEYDKALSSCPTYLEYEIAVLKSNIAACHLKLEDWKAAVESATASLDSLNKLQPTKAAKEKKTEGEKENGQVVEIEGEGEEGEQELAELKLSDEREEGIKRIKAKALLRRAKGKMEQGGWGNLAGAEEGGLWFNVLEEIFSLFAADYKELSKMPDLPPQDQKVVRSALLTLPPRINTAKDQEMGEMMGKLKELGNGILKPFGLSTDMFKMNQDPATGGYSMSFDQGK